MSDILEPEEIEASFAVEDSQGRQWWFHIAKVGGGTIGKEYVGEWQFLADPVNVGTGSYSGEFRTVIAKDHLGAALVGWAFISAEYSL